MLTKSGKPLFPIGIGTWNIGGTFSPDPTAKYGGTRPLYENEDEEVAAIRYSLSKGQNHIDCAELYGAFHTDEVVGKALVGLDRSDLFIADKLWRTSVGKGLVRPTVEKMLEKLGTDYLDMLYIHAPWSDVRWQEAIPQIDELIDEGIVRSLGVSNFTIDHMKEVQAIAKHSIAANQMNYNVLYRDEVTPEFRAYCSDNATQIIAYQPLKRQQVNDNETINRIAAKHGATAAQIALAWLLSQGIWPIPKAMQKEHIDENIGAVDIRLSDEDLTQLGTL
ncbi:MAG TPA: aldo/keto reductase [Candidatus Saccharimonadales bacterium]|nr:aldo/keto reductase [Candidatus Saccharimonadales bacterium]